jgi:hypothetical protein
MTHIDFSQNAVTVVGQDDGAHGIEQHFQHAAGTQRGADNARDRLGGLNVGELRRTTRLALLFGIYNMNESE